MTAPRRVLVSGEQLAAGVARLAAEIDRAHPDGVVLVGVLKGSVPFLADLARAVTVPVLVDFLAISSFEGAAGTGRVRLLKDLDLDIAERDVVLVEDIVDTGLTSAYLTGQLRRRGARSIEICALLDRASRRIVPVPVRFVGFEIGDEYALGYGLDFAGRYRNLGEVVEADLATLLAAPDAYVETVFGG